MVEVACSVVSTGAAASLEARVAVEADEGHSERSGAKLEDCSASAAVRRVGVVVVWEKPPAAVGGSGVAAVHLAVQAAHLAVHAARQAKDWPGWRGQQGHQWAATRAAELVPVAAQRAADRRLGVSRPSGACSGDLPPKGVAAQTLAQVRVAVGAGSSEGKVLVPDHLAGRNESSVERVGRGRAAGKGSWVPGDAPSPVAVAGRACSGDERTAPPAKPGRAGREPDHGR